jgi:hypothetical protein
MSTRLVPLIYSVAAAVPFLLNSDGFVFDQEFLVQASHLGFRIKEVPVPTRYLPEASSATFSDSTIYGLKILLLLGRYLLHRAGVVHLRQFESFQARYTRMV